jgi:hypothetical protein
MKIRFVSVISAMLLLLSFQAMTGCSGCGAKDEVKLARPDSLIAIADSAQKAGYASTIDSAKKETGIKIEKTVTYSGGNSAPDKKPEVGTPSNPNAPKFNYKAIDEATDELQEQIRPTIMAAKSRLGKTGAFAFTVAVSPDGRVKAFNLTKNDLDEQAAGAIRAMAMRHKYPAWDGGQMKEYKSELIKINF